MKEAVKHKIQLSRQNCLLRRAIVDIRRMAFRVCRERMLNWTGSVADDAYLQWPVSKFELASLFQSAIGDFAHLERSMVVSGNGFLNDGRLTIGRNSNLKKQVSVHDFSLETNRHPRQAFTFLATNV